MNIASERIREVIITHPDGSTLRAYRDSPDSNFQLADLPPDREIQSTTALNKFGSVLQEVSARDIRSLDTFEFDAAVETTVYTFDGLIADVRSTSRDDTHFANFSFRHDDSMPEEATQTFTNEDGEKVAVREQVQKLQQRLGGWVYLIPSFKHDVLTATLDDYTRQVGN